MVEAFYATSIGLKNKMMIVVRKFKMTVVEIMVRKCTSGMCNRLGSLILML